MAKAPIEPEAEALETPEIEETEEQQVQPEAQDAPEEPEAQEEPDADEEETIIGFGDEEEEPEAENETPTIKRLRERNREQTRLLREREKRIAELERVKPKAEIGPKPDLYGDCEGDPDLFEAALDKWKAEKAEADSLAERTEQGSRRVIESYNKDLEAYNQRKASLGVPDYEDAETVVTSALTMEQQAVALQAASDPAALVYALAKSPAKLAEIAKIDNPWKLSAAIAKLEGSVKVVTRKKGPNIDRPARGSASMAVSTDETLDQLEKEAEKTGNRSKVIAYKRSLKAQEK